MREPEEMLTVAEAARRLGRSIEQVRRYLREGKLPGRRIGQQWFIPAEAVQPLYRQTGGPVARIGEPAATLEVERMSQEGRAMTIAEIEALFKRIDANVEAIRKDRGGRNLELDIVKVLREEREAH